MKVLIAGGSGFLGTSLKNSLLQDQHEVFILTRHASKDAHQNSLGWEDDQWMGTSRQ